MRRGVFMTVVLPTFLPSTFLASGAPHRSMVKSVVATSFATIIIVLLLLLSTSIRHHRATTAKNITPPASSSSYYPSSRERSVRRALPSKVLIGYTAGRDYDTVRNAVVRDGVNVVIWSFVEIIVPESLTTTTSTLEEMREY